MFPSCGGPRTGSIVHKHFTDKLLLRRVIAVAAAYAIALASLIASLSAVRAAVADAMSSDIVICQQTALGQSAPGGIPADYQSNCVGCVVLLAAVPPPPSASITVEQKPGTVLPIPPKRELPSDPQARSYQSRGPPLAA